MTMNTKYTYDGTPKVFRGERLKMEEFSDKLFELSYTDLVDLNCTAYVTKEPLKFEEKLSGEKMNLTVSSKWAENVFDCAWFHIQGKIPEGYQKDELVLRINCGGEGLVYDSQGNPIQSITCFASDFSKEYGVPIKEVVSLTDSLCSGDFVDCWVDCGANDLFGKVKNESRVGKLSLSRLNKNIRTLAYDVQMLLFIVDLQRGEPFAAKAENTVKQIMEGALFTEEWAGNAIKLTAEILNEKNDGDNVFTYSGIGHAHLDLAWLWPIRESKRKAARTFATQIKNIQKYPQYVFGASQPQMYQWVKDEYPQLYKQVKELSKTPNWDIQGSTWVEMDSNLISGESMCRQFYYGKKFFKDEFGLDINIHWVPDSFGYSGCLPQVMKLSGVDYFLTQKMSWNLFNKFPYHTFNWRGIDGTEVFTHMLPESTYNSPARPDITMFGERNYKERKISNMAMSLYGIGDGGAGPGYEHIERAVRMKDLKGFPKFNLEKSVDFFKHLDNGREKFPTYEGELYLERHQGTYTTQSNNKKFNRKCEILLRNYEIISCLAADENILCPISSQELDEIWKEVLLYQFHDILPGSSINRVYEETDERYEIIMNRLSNAISLLAAKLYKKDGYANLNSYRYSSPVKLCDSWYSCNIAPMGFAAADSLKKLTDFKAACTANSIENDKIAVTFEKGLITGLFNKDLNRDFVPSGKGMGLVSQYTDNGDCWDMQNTRADYIATGRDAVCTDFATYKDGAKAGAKCTYTVGDCEIHQEFYILDGDPTVYCHMDIHVCQESSMLRVAFPTNLKSDEASFNIQFGHIKRPTTENNPVEIAQFEVSAQKFVDISEDSMGLSLINDCKYGYRVKNGVIDMNLIRSPKDGPGENVDQGVHTVEYAIFTHSGQVGSETYRKAYEINNPPVFVEAVEESGNSREIYTCSNDNIVLETLKKPLDNRGIITRFYNSSDDEQTAEIKVKGYKMAEIVNILEEKLEDKKDNALTFHKFQLVNIRWVKA